MMQHHESKPVYYGRYSIHTEWWSKGGGTFHDTWVVLKRDNEVLERLPWGNWTKLQDKAIQLWLQENDEKTSRTYEYTTRFTVLDSSGKPAFESSWTWCRSGPLETNEEILEEAKQIIDTRRLATFFKVRNVEVVEIRQMVLKTVTGDVT